MTMTQFAVTVLLSSLIEMNISKFLATSLLLANVGSGILLSLYVWFSVNTGGVTS